MSSDCIASPPRRITASPYNKVSAIVKLYVHTKKESHVCGTLLRCGRDLSSRFAQAFPRPCLFFEVTGSSLCCVRMVYITKKGSCLGTSSAVRTGLEPATSGVTGRYSNQLNYRTIAFCERLSLNCDAKIVCIFELCKCLDKKMQTFFLSYPRTRV